MASITFSGLATGLDTSALIDSLISLERIPINRLEDQKAAIASQTSKFGSLRSRLKSLKSAIEELDTRDEIVTSQVGSADSNVFTASVSGTPTTGNVGISVSALAQAERTYSDGFAAQDQTGLFGTGTLSIQVGSGAAVDITIDGTDTLESVVGKINDSDAAVSAGVIFDGTNYLLRVAGEDTGLANDITFTETGVSLGVSNPANQQVAARDAAFTVDGLAMTRSSNTVSDAIPGVVLELTGTSTGEVNLEVERDAAALETKVRAFVDSYNSVQNFVNSEFAFLGTARGADSLSGDATLRSLQSRFRNLASSAPSGLSGEIRTLASIGIDGSQTGTLTLDPTELESALATDPDGVMAILNGDDTLGVTGIFSDMLAAIDEYDNDTDGILKSRVDALEGRSDDLDNQIDRLERRIADTEENLIQQFATLEQTVSQLNNQGAQLTAILGGL